MVLQENEQYSHYDSKKFDNGQTHEGVQVTYSSTSASTDNNKEETTFLGAALCKNLDASFFNVVTTKGCIGWFEDLLTAQVTLKVKVLFLTVFSIDLSVGGNTKFPLKVTVPGVGDIGLTLEVQIVPEPKFAQICASLLITSICTPQIKF